MSHPMSIRFDPNRSYPPTALSITNTNFPTYTDVIEANSWNDHYDLSCDDSLLCDTAWSDRRASPIMVGWLMIWPLVMVIWLVTTKRADNRYNEKKTIFLLDSPRPKFNHAQSRMASPLIELITQRNELNLIAHPFSAYINILKHGKKQSVFCIPVLYSVMSLYFVARRVHADDNPMSVGILQIRISRVKYQKRNIPPFIKKKIWRWKPNLLCIYLTLQLGARNHYFLGVEFSFCPAM